MKFTVLINTAALNKIKAAASLLKNIIAVLKMSAFIIKESFHLRGTLKLPLRQALRTNPTSASYV